MVLFNSRQLPTLKASNFQSGRCGGGGGGTRLARRGRGGNVSNRASVLASSHRVIQSSKKHRRGQNRSATAVPHHQPSKRAQTGQWAEREGRRVGGVWIRKESEWRDAHGGRDTTEFVPTVWSSASNERRARDGRRQGPAMLFRGRFQAREAGRRGMEGYRSGREGLESVTQVYLAPSVYQL